MRRKVLAVLALAAAGMLMLTACTSSRTENSAEEQTSAADRSATDTEAEKPGGDTAVQETEKPGSDAAATDKSAEDSSQSGENVAEDIWSGTYAGEQESITIALNEDGTISFSFAQSGISGIAEVDGYQAIYNGDDDHILTFSMGQGVLNITVSHAEGYDTSASPLNGTYVPSY